MKSTDHKRGLVLFWAVLLLTGGGLMLAMDSNAGSFAANGMLRIGLVFFGLWLAWDSLRKPARWLPPGMAMIGVIAIAVIAAQPRLIFAVLPAFGVLLTVGSFVRAFRGDRKS